MVQTATLRILFVNGHAADQDQVRAHLELLGHPVSFGHAADVEELRRLLEEGNWTLILCLATLPQLNAGEMLEETKRLSPETPFVLISTGIGEEEVARLMKAGAEDVVLLSRSDRLIQVVKRILREKEVKEREVRSRSLAQQALASKEQMLAIVSHDIKNPLSAIQLEAQMLQRIADRHGKSVLGEEVRIQASRILRTTERMKGIICDLLDKSKNEEGLRKLNRSVVDLSKLFQEVLDSVRPLLREKGLNLQTSFPPEAIELELDKSKMFQVISNLLSNAVKHTPPGGTIRAGIEVQEHDDYCFFIADNGPGLPQGTKDRVFEKFWTGSVDGGNGLGLFICKTIVEAHGGRIWAENLAEGGCKFSFSLYRPASAQRSQWAGEEKLRVLVLDDDEDLREVMSWALEREGYSVQAFSDPQEALKNLQGDQPCPQLMIVDYHLEGSSGMEFLRSKNESQNSEVRDCPVLMISATPEDLNGSQRLLFLELVPKPIDLEALVSRVRKYLP